MSSITLALDWAVLGNHEFDVSEAAFRARLAESHFRIVSSNVSDVNGQPFPGTVRSAIVPLQAGGRTIRLGMIGLTIDSSRRPWVRYTPPVAAAREQLAQLQGKVDAVIALTHLSLAGDQDLVTQVPGIDLVLGGHEHENWLLRRGSQFTPIVKADANVRTVAIVALTFGRRRHSPTVTARFHVLDQRRTGGREGAGRRRTSGRRLPSMHFARMDSSPKRVVATSPSRWMAVSRRCGISPERLTDLITAAFDREAGGVDVAIMNGGSVRIDDVMQAGPVTEYDVLRILPFGGRVDARGVGRLTPAIRLGCGSGESGHRRFSSRAWRGTRWKRVD